MLNLDLKTKTPRLQDSNSFRDLFQDLFQDSSFFAPGSETWDVNVMKVKKRRRSKGRNQEQESRES